MPKAMKGDVLGDSRRFKPLLHYSVGHRPAETFKHIFVSSFGHDKCISIFSNRNLCLSLCFHTFKIQIVPTICIATNIIPFEVEYITDTQSAQTGEQSSFPNNRLRAFCVIKSPDLFQ